MLGIKRGNFSISAPKYRLGDIIDISYKKNDFLPDRIKIEDIVTFKRTDDKHGYWIYSCKSELYGYTYYHEYDIDKYTINYNLPCYKVPQVQYMYDHGFRFCGNFDTADIGKAISVLIDSSEDLIYGHLPGGYSQILRIIASSAYDKNAACLNPSIKQSIWVQYKKQICTESESGIPKFFRDITRT